MRQTALIPFRRKACWGFFHPKKSDGFGRVLNPRIWVPKASTLPLDHRRRLSHSNMIRIWYQAIPSGNSHVFIGTGTSFLRALRFSLSVLFHHLFIYLFILSFIYALYTYDSRWIILPVDSFIKWRLYNIIQSSNFQMIHPHFVIKLLYIMRYKTIHSLTVENFRRFVSAWLIFPHQYS